MTQWTGKTVLVVGMARSGIAAVQLLLESGAQVLLNDLHDLPSFEGKLDALIEGGAHPHLGEACRTLLDGIDAMVISPGVPIDAPFVKEAKEKGIPVIGELELGFLACACPVYAITGTNGKTTTTTLLGEIFKNAGKLVAVVGNIGIPFASVAAKMKPEDVVVCEVSSFQLESVQRFQPACAALLNITEDHLNRHGTMEIYAKMKQRIFENQKAGDVAVLNYDDAAVRAMADSIPAKVAWFSRKETVSYGAFLEEEQIVFGTPESHRTVCSIEDVKIPGAHNLENALAATAMAASCGVQLPIIRHTLRTFSGVEHRIEFVGEINGVRYINDSKGTNVDATIKAVEAMKQPTVLLLGGYDKHADFAPLAKVILDSKVHSIVVLGQTKEQIKTQLSQAGITRIHEANSFEEAVKIARDVAQYGENVLLSPACASFDMFSCFEERGETFKKLVGQIREGKL